MRKIMIHWTKIMLTDKIGEFNNLFLLDGKLCCLFNFLVEEATKSSGK